MASAPTGRIVVGVKAGDLCALAAFGCCTHTAPEASQVHIHTLIYRVNVQDCAIAFVLPDAAGGVGNTQAAFDALHAMASAGLGTGGPAGMAREVLSRFGFSVPAGTEPGDKRRFASAYVAFVDAEGAHLWAMGSTGPEEVQSILEAPAEFRPPILQAIAAWGPAHIHEGLSDLMCEVIDGAANRWMGTSEAKDSYKWLQVVALGPTGSEMGYGGRW